MIIILKNIKLGSEEVVELASLYTAERQASRDATLECLRLRQVRHSNIIIRFIIITIILKMNSYKNSRILRLIIII